LVFFAPAPPIFIDEVQMGTQAPNMSTISIIGSGGMAAAIGSLAAEAGHTVEVISRDAAKPRALAELVRRQGRSAPPRPGTSLSWPFPTQPFSTW
jgi:shikimate 5-dehydrogenase